ncbi:MAG: hypothetical protein ACYS8Z_24655, partial [Planctomycetota bacterium]
FASIWVETFSRHKRLLDLLSIMPVFLEKNVSEKILVDFKRAAATEVGTLSELICGIFPAADAEKAGQFLELQIASTIGLYQMTNLSEMQKKVLEYPEFQHMKMDFDSYLQKAVGCLLQGIIA